MATLNEILANNLKTPVKAGLDVKVYQDEKYVGWATNIRCSDDFELQGIRVLGNHGDIGFKSMGFTGQMTIGTLVLDAGISDNLTVPERDGILNQTPKTFRISDVSTDEVLITIVGSICGGADITFQEGQLVTKDTTWRYINRKDGNVS